MRVALGVVQQIDAFANGRASLVTLDGVGYFSRHTGEGPTADPQPDNRVGADVPYPASDSSRPCHRDLRRTQLYQIRHIVSPDDTDAFTARLAGLATDCCEDAKADGGTQQEEWQHHRAEDLSTSCRAQQPRVLRDFRRGGRP